MAIDRRDGGWLEYSKLVLNQLEANTRAITEIGNAMHQLRGELNTQLGQIRLQTVQDLAELEKSLGAGARGEVSQIREHFDEEIVGVQKTFDTKIQGISSSFEKRVGEVNTLLTNFIKDVGVRMEKISNDITGLQIKAGLWGAGGSILGVIAIYLLSMLPKALGFIK